jgi:hypothetical protein
MAQTQVNITERNEVALNIIETIAKINGIKASNKELQINFAIDIAWKLVSSLDEDSLFELTGLKKSV